MSKIINPENHDHWLRLRSSDITSSEVAALFGLSPYITKFELWHRKKEQTIVTLDENFRMKWGNRLESSIAHGIAEDNSWDIVPMKYYMRNESIRMGSSFDFRITSPFIGLLEIKNVDSLQFKDKWFIDDNGIEAPPHIEVQVQHQLSVAEMDVAYIGALVGGNEVKLIKRIRSEKIINKIKSEIKRFWESIESNTPPEPDFKRDAEFIASVYNYAEVGNVYDAKGDAEMESLVSNYKLAADDEKSAKQRKDEAKARMLMIVKDAEKILGDGFTISAGLIGPTKVEYERSGYRNFRIFHKKNKGE